MRWKSERYVISECNTYPWNNFCDPHWEHICCKKWHPGIKEISTTPEIAVGTHIHARHDTKTTPMFSCADKEGS